MSCRLFSANVVARRDWSEEKKVEKTNGTSNRTA
jgi:hypothetical protein